MSKDKDIMNSHPLDQYLNDTSQTETHLHKQQQNFTTEEQQQIDRLAEIGRAHV